MERYHSNDHSDDAGDLDALLHPSQAFGHPSDVVRDPDLTLNENGQSSGLGASDACAIEAIPTLRRLPGGKRPVPFDEVMDALRTLDAEVRQSRRGPSGPRVAERWRKNPKSGTPDQGRGQAIS